MWFFRLPDWVKDFSQESHLKLLCPSWNLLMWLFKICDAVRDFPQESHLYFLFSPWTVLRCFCNSFFSLKVLLHTLQTIVFSSSPWISFMCRSLLLVVVKLFSQISHLKFWFIISWGESIFLREKNQNVTTRCDNRALNDTFI